VFNVRERGNLATNSHFVALYDRARQGRLESRQRVVFSIAASGLTGGTALYALDDLPDRLRQKLNGYPSSSGSASHSGVWCPKQHIGIEAVALLGGQARRSSVVEMAAAVARDCLANAGVAMSELDVLIYCGVYRERLLSEPAVAALVLGELGGDYGANGHARLAFDISDAAVGFLKACHCAAQLIDAGRAPRALVVAAELPGDPAVSFRGARPLAATASAALIGRSHKTSGKFDSFAFKTFAEHGRIRESFCRHANQAPELVIEAHAGYDKMATTCQAALVQTLLSSERGQFDTIL
jgi:3-oxoacyl-[acyl-carrier-protein] synthase III